MTRPILREKTAMAGQNFHLTTASRGRIPRFTVGLTVREMDRDRVFRDLCVTDVNRSGAAQLLGLSVRTMRNKITEYSAEGVKIRPLKDGFIAPIGTSRVACGLAAKRPSCLEQLFDSVHRLILVCA